MKRRTFIVGAVGSAVVPGIAACAPAGDPVTFDHGVASGDPLSDSVILWTRVSGMDADSVDVDWEVATEEAMRNTVASGTVSTGPERDYTVKVDATGLPAGQTLYYRFTANGAKSPIGRTKTLATGGLGSAAFAVVSCSARLGGGRRRSRGLWTRVGVHRPRGRV